MFANVFHLTTHKQTELQWGLKTKQFWSDNVTEGRVGLQDRNAFFPSWCTQTHTSKKKISNFKQKAVLLLKCVCIFCWCRSLKSFGSLWRMFLLHQHQIRANLIASREVPFFKILINQKKDWLSALALSMVVDFYFKLILRLLSCLYTLQSHI